MSGRGRVMAEASSSTECDSAQFSPSRIELVTFALQLPLLSQRVADDAPAGRSAALGNMSSRD